MTPPEAGSAGEARCRIHQRRPVRRPRSEVLRRSPRVSRSPRSAGPARSEISTAPSRRSVPSSLSRELLYSQNGAPPAIQRPVEIDQSHLVSTRSRSPTRLSAARSSSMCRCSPSRAWPLVRRAPRASRAGGARLHRGPRRAVGTVRPNGIDSSTSPSRRRGHRRGRKAVGDLAHESTADASRRAILVPFQATQPLGDGHDARPHASGMTASDAIGSSGERPAFSSATALRALAASTPELISGPGAVT